MWDSVMKFGYACTFTGKPRGETPAPPPEKTNLGITAPAGVPRAVPPNRQVDLPSYACSLPHRTPPASCVWRAYPPPSHKTCHEAMYWAELAVRCAGRRRDRAAVRDKWICACARLCQLLRLRSFYRPPRAAERGCGLAHGALYTAKQRTPGWVCIAGSRRL